MKGRHADKNKQGAPVDNDGGGGYATAAGDNDDDNGADDDDDEGDMILFAMKERHWCGRAQAGKQAGQGTGGGSFCSKWPWIGNPEEYKTRISFDSPFFTWFLPTRHVWYIILGKINHHSQIFWFSHAQKFLSPDINL